MNEKDIIKNIAENLSERKSSAALNNYGVLCNNINYVNELLEFGIVSLNVTRRQIENDLKDDRLVNSDFKDNNNPLFYFRTIIPRIVLNDISIIEKFVIYTRPDDRQGITIDNVGELERSFIDYNNLVTSTRQIIDSFISDAYQLFSLDAKETNFHVLTSLSSFNKYATKSIRQALFNTDIQNALKEFEQLSYQERIRGTESNITKCDKKTFGDKVDYLFTQLGLNGEVAFKEEVKNIFSFSSEFTHIGYVSTFFTSTNGAEVIFGDEISPYLPSTENFSELKYEILNTVIKCYSFIYLPSLISALNKAFLAETANKYDRLLNEISSDIITKLKTRNNEYYFFVRQDLVQSDEVVNLTCMCGEINNWHPPHDLSKAYCKSCGSKFIFIELEGDPGYVITSNGPVKVIGSNVPDFDDLLYEEKIKLFKQ